MLTRREYAELSHVRHSIGAHIPVTYAKSVRFPWSLPFDRIADWSSPRSLQSRFALHSDGGQTSVSVQAVEDVVIC